MSNARNLARLLPNTSGQLPKSNMALGAVLQVVNASYNGAVTSTSTSYADTGLTATITPTSITSKILVIVDQAGCEKEAANMQLMLKLQRGSTDLVVFEAYGGAATSSVSMINFGTCSCNLLDSPATTSPVTYKTQYACSAAGRVYVQQAGGSSTITLMEIAA